ncbi:hypothetical protein PtB15_5B477 [Puccinia triticina]|nr:hypothetical protein PtB15_5B477 [Puccinia triticina]
MSARGTDWLTADQRTKHCCGSVRLPEDENKWEPLIEPGKDRDTTQGSSVQAVEEGVVETQTVTNPGIAPVDKDVGKELLFEEAVESFNPKAKESAVSKEPDFIEFMKAVPNVGNPSTDPKSLLLEQALAAQLSGNAKLANTFLKAIAVLAGTSVVKPSSVQQVQIKQAINSNQ